MRSKKAFFVYPRSAGKKRKTYYAAFLDPETGTYNRRRALFDAKGDPVTSRGIAEDLARAMAETGIPVRGDEPLADYLKAFWAAAGAYAAARSARGHALAAGYLANSCHHVENHVAPYLKKTHPGILLSKTTSGTIEGLVMHLHGQGELSARTINAIRQSMAVPLGWAARMGRIPKNPAAGVERLAEQRYQREIFTPEEVSAFFGLDWEDPRQLAINLLAATTGLRLGECLGLLLRVPEIMATTIPEILACLKEGQNGGIVAGRAEANREGVARAHEGQPLAQ